MPLWEQSWQVERRSAETKSGEGEGIVHVEADGKADGLRRMCHDTLVISNRSFVASFNNAI
jgi:hypothetical protein